MPHGRGLGAGRAIAQALIGTLEPWGTLERQLTAMFTLDRVVPWGRSFDEYCRVFALSSDDLQLTILGCGDGPASFNAEATRRGSRVVSCDPLYRFETQQIRERVANTYEEVLEQTRRNQHEFVWTDIASVDELGRVRMDAMTAFLDDYERGKAEGRYIDAELPSLPFVDGAFELAVCSHFLFLYTTQLGEAFHHGAIRELCRVANEVRIFPLLALGGAANGLEAGSPCQSKECLTNFRRAAIKY